MLNKEKKKIQLTKKTSDPSNPSNWNKQSIISLIGISQMKLWKKINDYIKKVHVIQHLTGTKHRKLLTTVFPANIITNLIDYESIFNYFAKEYVHTLFSQKKNQAF